jgi:hypothetical protein
MQMLSETEANEVKRLIRSGNRFNTGYWAIGFLTLATGSFLVANYIGVLLAIGITFLAMAISQEIKGQIYPIGVLALTQLHPTLNP